MTSMQKLHVLHTPLSPNSIYLITLITFLLSKNHLSPMLIVTQDSMTICLLESVP